VWQHAFTALGTDVLVASDDEECARALELLTASYPPAAAAPTLTFEIVHDHGWSVLRRGVAAHGVIARPCATRAEALGAFELSLYEGLVACAGPGWILHASAVSREQKALLLAGPSGAGKSTMTLALLSSGTVSYVGDEYVRVDERGDVDGLARPLMFGRGPTLATPHNFAFRRCTLRAGRGEGEAVVLLPPAARVALGRSRAAAVVCLAHSPEKPAGVRRLSPGEALTALWHCTWRASQPDLELATSLSSRLPAFALVTHDVEQARADLEELWQRCE
jgi:hypothetical protein